MKLFPKTVKSCGETYYGAFDSDENKISINISDIKQNVKYWRRHTIAVWCHEFSHFLYHKFNPYSQMIVDFDPFVRFKDELIAHNVQRFVETLLLIPHQWNSVDEGAVTSLTDNIHNIKEFYGVS